MKVLSDGGLKYDEDELRSMRQQAVWDGKSDDAASRSAYGLGYDFQTMEEIASDKNTCQKNWLIKNLIASGETSAWIGPPGSLKSALMADLAMFVSDHNNDESWHGRKSSTGLWNVVYFALERYDLVKRRLLAQMLRTSPSEREACDYPSIATISAPIELMSPESVGKIVRTVRNFDAFNGGRTRLVIFDTFAKLIANGGGDEQTARDQGRVFANIQKIKDALDPGPGTIGPPHVALVGHTGKDESRGARGSNAFLGDVDLMIQISGDAVKTATVTKANDYPEGALFSFASETYEFGKDEDGDPITVNIVSDEEPAAVSASKSREPALRPNQRTMFTILHDAGRSGLAMEEWNAAAREAGIGVKRKADLVDIRTALKSKNLVHEYGGRWVVNHAG